MDAFYLCKFTVYFVLNLHTTVYKYYTAYSVNVGALLVHHILC